MFDRDFLAKQHADLYGYLVELFGSNQCAYLILHNKFHYVWKDWFSGENYRISLNDAIL